MSISELFGQLIRQKISRENWEWLEEKARSNDIQSFNTAFASIPRKTGKQVLQITGEQRQFLNELFPGFSLQDWTVDRLARVWLLMQTDSTDQQKYFQQIEKLFLTGEMNELVALYSALPFLAYPDMWVRRCAEGIRSNIGDVLQAIMYENPYPAKYLPQPAWNQLVLKAFFTEKAIDRITGLDERANTELAHILSDYAHERWAAGRAVNPQLWRCVGKFIDEKIFPDIARMMISESSIEREAAALSCEMSNYPPAKSLINNNADLPAAIQSGSLTWKHIAEKSRGE